ncbi:hypothetical protein NQ315_011587 [Exocentrus adspersus]|uniref:trypsin n=1 Tax=Exocentrus adspersus TaxID=1586481 RepID=A0AAV8VVE0_9CUCU|nr:hypothetical protein NQ315_011587 [Exocentrus adspersus]
MSMLNLVAFNSFIIPIIAIVIDQQNYAGSPSSSRIIGGKEVNITDYPYLVAVEVNKKFNCAGSIIARTWILTGAECLSRASVSNTRIRIGTSFVSKGGQLREVLELIRHANYNFINGDYDIALIALYQRIPLSEYAQIIRLPDNTNVDLDGRLGTAMGWGEIRESGPGSSVLRAVDIPIVNLDVCRQVYNTSHGLKVTSRMLCAGFWDGGKATGVGDGGGPLVVDSVLIGITSWSVGRGRPEDPEVLTNVAYFRDWITHYTGI